MTTRRAFLAGAAALAAAPAVEPLAALAGPVNPNPWLTIDFLIAYEALEHAEPAHGPYEIVRE